ncbi:hypothetical protein ACET3Z_008044 [Daucus carota]
MILWKREGEEDILFGSMRFGVRQREAHQVWSGPTSAIADGSQVDNQPKQRPICDYNHRLRCLDYLRWRRLFNERHRTPALNSYRSPGLATSLLCQAFSHGHFM